MALVVAAVLDADQGSLGPAEVTPLAGAAQQLAGALDAPEEVVGRQEQQVAAAVAKAGDGGQLAVGDVLVVAREDDQVVGRGEACRGRGLQLVIGDRVHRDAVLDQPLLERHVVAAEERRDATPQERARQIDGGRWPARVPGVTPAVAVGVVEVVGLPRVGRDHDGDPVLAQQGGAHDERGEADPAVGGDELREVDAGGDLWHDDLDVAGGVAVLAPVDRLGGADRNAHHGVIGHGLARVALRPEQLQRERGCVGGNAEAGAGAGGRARERERRIDTLDAHHRPALTLARRRQATQAAPVARVVGDRDPDQVAARAQVGRRQPVVARRPGREVEARLEHRFRRLRCGCAVEDDGGCLAEREADRGAVAHAVAVRRDGGQQRAVAGVGGAAVDDAQMAEARCGGVDAERCLAQQLPARDEAQPVVAVRQPAAGEQAAPVQHQRRAGRLPAQPAQHRAAGRADLQPERRRLRQPRVDLGAAGLR